MGYTPTTWTTGDKITATKLNKIEQGIAHSGGSAVVYLSASGFGSATQNYFYVTYGFYDSANSRWVFVDEGGVDESVVGFSNKIPKIIPLYLTILPNDSNLSLFVYSQDSRTSFSVTGDIAATTLYYSYGSAVSAYRITGDGSIALSYS